jgi:hypothetical protein
MLAAELDCLFASFSWTVGQIEFFLVNRMLYYGPLIGIPQSAAVFIIVAPGSGRPPTRHEFT